MNSKTTKTPETQTVYGIFNKHNGVLFQFENDQKVAYGYSTQNFFVKEIILKPGEYFFGDYYTGKVYSEEDKPLIREDQMEEDYYQGILKDFSIIKQLITIAGVLELNKDIIKTEQFDLFIKYLKNKEARYTQSLKSVMENKESFNFISLQEIEDHIVKRMEGIV